MGLIQAVRRCSSHQFELFFILVTHLTKASQKLIYCMIQTSTSINFPFNTNQVKKSFHIETEIMQNVKGNRTDHKPLKKFLRCANGLRKIYRCVKSTF